MSDEIESGPAEEGQIRRGPGRPKKAVADREPMREPMEKASRWKMRATPNWETMDASGSETPDRYRIDPSLVPDGMSLQWVTDSVYGQAMPRHRSDFERGGWTPVHQEDFDGQFDGLFMSKGQSGEINVDGLVLMARPKELTERAEHKNRMKAYEQVSIKERALRGGDLPVSLDPTHPSAISSNRVNKTLERVEIPKD